VQQVVVGPSGNGLAFPRSTRGKLFNSRDMHEHVDGSARMKIIPENMNDVWTIVEGIDGKVTVELGSGVALPGVPAVSSVNNQLRHLVDRLPH
jgi:hypothetical protein